MQKIVIAKTQNRLRRIAVVALGWILILGGTVGLVLPIVPGAVLIVVGALMVYPQSARLRRALENSRTRFPVLERALRRLPYLRRELAEPL
jgi:uncharacterized membrane protein YbaN (DUF454 family)